ncbi:hypothetical protein D3C71_1768340 [compost metagenome]
MADAANAYHRYAVLFRHFDGVVHTQLGCDVPGTVVAIKNCAARAGFFKGEMRVVIGAAFADAFRIIFHPHRAVGMDPARIRMDQNVRDNPGVFLA